MRAGPGDETAAGAGGHGRLRASHADREQVIAVLKAAFVQGMLDRDEFGQRLGQAFTSRTRAELDTVTADLPAGLAAAQPPAPAQAPDGARVLRPGRVIAAATTLYAGVWPFTFALPWPVNSEGDPPAAVIGLFFSTTLIYLFVVAIAVGFAIAGWREKRSGGQLPRRPEPGASGPAARRLPPAGPARQLPPTGSGHQNVAEAARSRRRPRRRRCAAGALSPN
jgi:Domain of unknown function (DUF1707)